MSNWTGMGPNTPAPKLDPTCQCICHTQPGVMHVVACCASPAEQADFDLTMRIRGAAGDIAKAQIAAREDGE